MTLIERGRRPHLTDEEILNLPNCVLSGAVRFNTHPSASKFRDVSLGQVSMLVFERRIPRHVSWSQRYKRKRLLDKYIEGQQDKLGRLWSEIDLDIDGIREDVVGCFMEGSAHGAERNLRRYIDMESLTFLESGIANLIHRSSEKGLFTDLCWWKQSIPARNTVRRVYQVGSNLLLASLSNSCSC